MSITNFTANKYWVFFVFVFGFALLSLSACGGGGELAVGDPAPAFSLPTSQGSTVSLGDYVGTKPALLYFHMAVG